MARAMARTATARRGAQLDDGMLIGFESKFTATGRYSYTALVVFQQSQLLSELPAVI